MTDNNSTQETLTARAERHEFAIKRLHDFQGQLEQMAGVAELAAMAGDDKRRENSLYLVEREAEEIRTGLEAVIDAIGGSYTATGSESEEGNPPERQGNAIDALRSGDTAANDIPLSATLRRFEKECEAMTVEAAIAEIHCFEWDVKWCEHHGTYALEHDRKTEKGVKAFLAELRFLESLTPDYVAEPGVSGETADAGGSVEQETRADELLAGLATAADEIAELVSAFPFVSREHRETVPPATLGDLESAANLLREVATRLDIAADREDARLAKKPVTC